ncbi:GIY-YIG nuclease family protein [Candidatus Microgenomates bacterium]|nr:GIY-YIG nuclease family protein [Candidatus Microgenomates bacterium]
MFCYVYLLVSKQNGDFYVGMASDLKQRLAKHQSGQQKTTKGYRPWRLLYYEAHLNRDDAKRREKYLKTTTGNRMLKLMLRSQLALSHQRSTT